MDKQGQDLYLAFLCARLDIRLVQLSDYVVANDADVVSTAKTGRVAADLSLVLNCLAISLLTSSIFWNNSSCLLASRDFCCYLPAAADDLGSDILPLPCFSLRP
jgi:hypothetical protein